MAYVALYRAYRPQTFKEVAGQKHIVKTLQNALKLNKVAHAYLFCGPRGTGKTSLAKIMAKALNCVHGPTADPCNECSVCVGITKNMINDVIEIDAASNNGVDEIRELRDGIKYTPSVGNYKVYIIDEVHMLSMGAFNALLKTLEEPPKHAIFILATTEPHKIPATILSRTQRFDFQAISASDVYDRLKEVASLEKIKIENEALLLISEFCEGGMRDGLSLLDQSISYSTNEQITSDDVLRVSGNVSTGQTLELLKACFLGDGTKTLNVLEDILSQGKEIPRIVNDLIIFLRDVLLQKINSLKTLKAIYQTNEFINFCGEIKNPLIYSWLNTLSEIQNNIKFSNQKRAFLELGLLSMSDKEKNDYANLLARLDELERRMILNPNYQERKEIVETSEKKVTLADKEEFITIEQIEDILNNSNKQKREEVTEVFARLLEDEPNNLLIQILCNGQVVVTSDKIAIITLADDSFCNRLMKYENFEKVIDIINKDEVVIEDYICLPISLWTTIKNDYMNKYKAGIAKPTLEKINIYVKQHEVSVTSRVSDPFLRQANDLFGTKTIDIEEEN